jgi:hypothetical protein
MVRSTRRTIMASIWEAPDDVRRTAEAIKLEHHPHLANASLWVLCADGKAIRNNQLVVTQSKRCTKTEKLSSGHDFKIIVLMEAWSILPDVARKIALDEALCRCGVKYVPQTVEVNGRKEVVKDELGRTVYTDQIEYDAEGTPKWRINPADAGLYYPLLQRHGQYSEEAENVTRSLAGKPIKRPTIAERADQLAA